MRDPARIPLVIAELWHCWKLEPDLRLGQLLINATQRPETGLGSLFYIEDDELLEALRAFAARTPPAPATPAPESPSTPDGGSSPSSTE